MRVTQGMISDNNLRHLTNSYSKMNTYLEQINTGKKISKVSQDPVVGMKGMAYRTELGRVEQFQRNTGEVNNWMDNSDSALDKTTLSLQKLRELAVQASNDSLTGKERANIKQEAEQLKEHLVDIANTKVNGKYIFNGSNTGEAPVKVDGEGNIVDDAGERIMNDNGTMKDEKQLKFGEKPVKIEVSDGTKIQANVDGNRVFGGEDENNMFSAINKFVTALGDDKQKDISASISDLDEQIDDVVNARADLGARMNRMELIEDRLAEQKEVATKMMSSNEDVDYEVAITDLITQESMHRAALAAGSRIIQPSLMDFLR